MQPTPIGLREFLHNIKKVERAVKRGQSFMITRHNKPIFQIEKPEQNHVPVGKRLVEDMKHMQFRSGDPSLSQKIDEIVYEDRR